jgi:hypothetical protein
MQHISIEHIFNKFHNLLIAILSLRITETNESQKATYDIGITSKEIQICRTV